jgi:hypothetical protein
MRFTDIPRPALILGVAGLIPFLIGAALLLVPPGTLPTLGLTRSQPQGGVFLLIRYGTVILCFMAGCLWGFAARPDRRPTTTELAVTVLPAIWITYALAIAGTNQDHMLALILGFLALLPADFVFQRAGIAPVWWMSLRIPLTSVVVACLLVGVLS